MAEQSARINEWRWQIEDSHLRDATSRPHRSSTGLVSVAWPVAQHSEEPLRSYGLAVDHDTDRDHQTMAMDPTSGSIERRLLPNLQSATSTDQVQATEAVSAPVPKVYEQTVASAENELVDMKDDDPPELAPLTVDELRAHNRRLKRFRQVSSA